MQKILDFIIDDKETTFKNKMDTLNIYLASLEYEIEEKQKQKKLVEQSIKKLNFNNSEVGVFLSANKKVMECLWYGSNKISIRKEDKIGNKFLEVTDGSTERVYFMTVQNFVKNCKEAHESICGVDEDMFLMQS